MTTTRASQQKYWCWILGDPNPFGVMLSPLSDVDDLLLAATERSSRLRTHDSVAIKVFRFLDVTAPPDEIVKQGIDTFLVGSPHALSDPLLPYSTLGVAPDHLPHFIIELPQQAPELPSPEPDSLGELPAFRFQQLMSKCQKLKVPSESSKSTEYKREQGDSTAMLDGRYNQDHPQDNTGPPIDIFHPCFADFKHDVESLAVTDQQLVFAAEFVHAASGIYTSESQRTRALLEPFLNALGLQLSRVTNADGTQADAVMEYTFRGRKVLLILREDKNEIGCGASAPDVQGAHSIRRWWVQEINRDTANVSCCPCFLISTAGPHLMVSGVVITQDVIVRPLTQYLHAVDVSHDDSHYRYIARVFGALRRGYENLMRYWNQLPPPSSFLVPSPSRFHPWRTSYPFDGQDVFFKYLHPLESDRSTVTFLAELLEPHDKIVVKFAETGSYDPKPHRLLASKGYSPRLRYVGPLRLGSHLDIIVMDFVDGKTLADFNDHDALTPAAIKEQITEGLIVLHEADYVFGDLRPENVMITKDFKVNLIDTNWVGKDGVARYPIKMNMSLNWAPGMGRLKVMQKEHDWGMLERLLQR